MLMTIGLVGALLLGQSAASSADRAATASERAAAAAERAADAAERAATAAEKAVANLQQPPPAPPASAPTNAPNLAAKPHPWTYTAGLGLISITGNARAITLTANAAALMKTEKMLVNLTANGSYGQSQAVGVAAGTAPQILALQALFSAQVDYRFTEIVSGYAHTGVDTDHVMSVEHREYGEIGVGIIWLNRKEGDLQKVYLNTDVGFRYQHEARFQYFPVVMDVPDVDLVAPRVAGSFRYAINKGVIFSQDAEVLPAVIGPSRVLVNTTSKIAAQLVSTLSVNLAFAVTYDSRPAVSRVPTDTALTVGFQAAM